MGLDVTNDTPGEVGRRVADWLRAFMKKLDVPTCTSFGLDEEKLVACTEYLKSEGLTNFGKRVPTEEELPQIMRAVYNSCK